MSDPTPREIVETATRLAGGLRDFAARERGVDRARQIRESNLRQDLEERRERIRAEADRDFEKAREAAAEEVRRIEAVAEARRERIGRAGIRVRTRAIEDLEKEQGRRKAQLQRDLIEAEQRRNREVEDWTERREAERARLGELRSSLLATEKAVARELRGFPGKARRYRKLLRTAEGEPGGESGSASGELAARLETAVEAVRQELEGYRSAGVSWFNRFPFVFQAFLVLGIAGALPFFVPSWREAILSGNWPVVLAALGAGAGGVLVLQGIRSSIARRAGWFLEDAAEPIGMIRRGRIRVREILEEELEDRYAAERREIESDWEEHRQRFEAGLSAGSGKVETVPGEPEERAGRLRGRLEDVSRRRIESVREACERTIAEIEANRQARLDEIARGEDPGGEADESREGLARRWREELEPEHERLQAWSSAAAPEPLNERDPEDWEPPDFLPGAVRIGRFRWEAGEEDVDRPRAGEFRLEGAQSYDIPFRLSLPAAGSIVFESGASGKGDHGDGRAEALDRLRAAVVGWLAAAPPGRLSFHLIDPVGLGESFAGLMHLADYDEQLVAPRIWTRSEQIEECLGELCGHMEKVIQMYLRDDYETIVDYNEAAGSVAERYRFVVIADFPAGFSELAMKRLHSIAVSGARCGVYLLLHRDAGAALPSGAAWEEIEAASLRLRWKGDRFSLVGEEHPGELELDPVPDGSALQRWIHRLGEANRDSQRVEVPFSVIAPEEGRLWTHTTESEVRVAIGRKAATKFQDLVLGVGTCQHALVAGKTGSGKSTLFHVLVTNLALWHSPDEVEFYLIDFKKGVEFKCYAENRLPHARVVAIESDREFGLSVLDRVDAELRRRGELFRAAGVQDLEAYRSLEGAEPMPRTLLLIDEFQEFFVEDDSVSQDAAVRLDRIVRQGRAFGIHAVLGSQTLGGAFTLARATLGQMTVRIALACNESDAYLIMDDSNPAPRLLTRPGEGIYNDRAGSEEANSPFQVVWLEEAERDRRLREVREHFEASGAKEQPCFVFEGDRPGSVERLPGLPRAGEGEPVIYLGEPNAIRPVTSVEFPRQGNANLLLVGPRSDLADALIAISLRLLAEQLGEGGRIVLVDQRIDEPEGSGWFRDAIHSIPGLERVPPPEAPDRLRELSGRLEEGAGDAAPVFLAIPSLQKYKKLRFEEDFSFSLDEEPETAPGQLLRDLLVDGPEVGVHLILSFDSRANLVRSLGRGGADHFEKRVLFQMSEVDSASLIDSAAASRLGMHRALLHDEVRGSEEIFRPFAEPSLHWFREPLGPGKSG